MKLTRQQLNALRDVVMERGCSRYMHKLLQRKRLVFSYLEVTNKGREVLRQYGGIYSYGD